MDCFSNDVTTFVGAVKRLLSPAASEQASISDGKTGRSCESFRGEDKCTEEPSSDTAGAGNEVRVVGGACTVSRGPSSRSGGLDDASDPTSAKITTNLLEARQDVISDVLGYCSSNEFFFLAGVSKIWNASWKARGRTNHTSVHLTLSTPARTEQALCMDDQDFEHAADKLGGVFALAAQAGNLDVLKLSTSRYGECWIFERSTRLVTSFAARNGHLDVLKWAHEMECPWGRDTFRCAARGGHVSVMQWLYANGCSWDASTCASAAMGGHLEALKWAREKQCPWDEKTCSNAAMNGHLAMLQWARKQQCPWDEKTCSNAALHGHLEVLQWARAQQCPWDENTCNNAALGGHLKVLKWAWSQSCPWNEKTCSNAAQGGHLEVIKWARAQGCRWREDTCSAAAKGGHLEVLKWARAEKCPWDENTSELASRRGHMEIFKWAIDHGCPEWSPELQTSGFIFTEGRIM